MVQTLPDSLTPLLTSYGREIIRIRGKLFNKRSVVKKMDDDADYIPKSARASKFEITASQAVKDDKSDRIEFLQQQVLQAKKH